MQDGAVWKLAVAEARLDFGGLLATIDLTRPELGLTGISFQGCRFKSTALLGVELQHRIAPPIAEAYVRQRDLIVTYTQTPELPFRVQIYWRAASGPAGSPAIDLQVSVQTSLLDSRPALTTVTSLGDAQRLRLVEVSAGGNLHPSHGYDIFRPADGGASYVEMIHPADNGNGSQFVASDASRQTPTNASISHHLFASFLEKGVILRARLRGVFLPRQGDSKLAAEAYRQFLAEPPPLTT
jgi:hypothetical protein